MKVYIEALVILILFLMFVVWFLWFKWTERRLKKKYDRRKDKGRKGGELNAEEFRTEEPVDRVEKPDSDSNGLGTVERPELLQETSTDDVGKNLNSNRKTRFFRRT